MVRQFSTALGSNAKAFRDAGVFDGFIEVDTKLYIDPYLLESSSAPEIKASAEIFKQYFADLITILKRALPNTIFRKEATRKLIFHEIPELSLGYSAHSTRGSAIGLKLARSIARTAHEIVVAGVEEPEIFELIGLIEESIGADRISDMTASIIIEHLLNYSQRIVNELKLSNQKFKFRDKEYKLPYDNKTQRLVILVPSDILRNLPTAYDWSDIDIVCAHNRELREKVNRIIGRTWHKATTKVKKEKLKNILIANPDALRDLIDSYKSKDSSPYNISLDPQGELNWYPISQEYTKEYPVDLSEFRTISPDNILELVKQLCHHFRRLVENNGLNELLYNEDNGRQKHERAAQLLFFGIADAYCEANNIDLSREPNAGKGPVDFKVSYGYFARVNVEVKYSSNPKLLAGYGIQLETYNKAERTEHSIFLIIKTKKLHKHKLEELSLIRQDAIASNQRAPEIIIVDAQRYPSASRLKRRATKTGFSIGS